MMSLSISFEEISNCTVTVAGPDIPCTSSISSEKPDADMRRSVRGFLYHGHILYVLISTVCWALIVKRPTS